MCIAHNKKLNTCQEDLYLKVLFKSKKDSHLNIKDPYINYLSIKLLKTDTLLYINDWISFKFMLNFAEINFTFCKPGMFTW